MNSMKNSGRHLSEDEITKAVVDRNDLPADRREHLEDCAICRERVMRFESQLVEMGNLARNMAPLPSRSFRLPRAGIKRRWQLKPIMAAGVAALVLFAVVIWHPERVFSPGGSSVASFDAADDQRLIDDIDDIVENALPEAYQELTAFNIPDWSADDLEDDPADWTLPSLQENDDEDFLS